MKISRLAAVAALLLCMLAVSGAPASAQQAPAPGEITDAPAGQDEAADEDGPAGQDPPGGQDAPAAGDAPAGGDASAGNPPDAGIDVPEPDQVPDVSISVESDDAALSRTVIVLLLLTVGSIAPALLLLMTTFTRFVIVLGLTKNALALHTVPPAQVMVGLALFLTFFAMQPVFAEINDAAVQPFLSGEIEQGEALEAGTAPLREFMLAQTRETDLALFVGLSNDPQPEGPEDLPLTTVIPSFVISELRAAFVTGFVIFMPFLVIDLVVASVLMSLGMVMLPPVFVSLPIKLLLFVLVDGWVLIAGSLVGSVNGVAA